MPTVSIVTPTHNIKRLERCARSVAAQTYKDFEWIVAVNGGLLPAFVEQKLKEWVPELVEIKQVKVIRVENNFKEQDIDPATGKKAEMKVTENCVGYIKAQAFAAASGDFLVELDHDDELSVDAIEEIANAFNTNPDASFVYSECQRIYEAGHKIKETGQVMKGGEEVVWGGAWRYHDAPFNGFDGVVVKKTAKNPPVLPQNVSRIWYAPDHVRAFRRDLYKKVGGHNPRLPICDDLDLMSRLYMVGTFVEIQKVLYRYTIHDDNTWKKNLDPKKDDPTRNISYQTVLNHCNRIHAMALMEARRRGEEAVDLGGGYNPLKGWTSCDQHDADVIADLNQSWPWKDDSVAVFRAQDLIEHLPDQIHTMNEAWRCLKHGGLFLVEVPSTDGRGAHQDPTHVSFWNSNSFWYYCKSYIQKFISHTKVKAKFQIVHIENYFPSPWHQQHEILYVRAHLAAVKEGGEQLHGELEIGSHYETLVETVKQQQKLLEEAQRALAVSGNAVKTNQR